MKKYLLPLIILLISVCITQISFAQCTENASNFDVTYKGYTDNNNGSVTLRFSIKNSSAVAFTYAAFELPASTKATWPTTSYKGKYQYSIENGAAIPFPAIKYTGTNTSAFKNGQQDDFYYTIAGSAFNKMENFRVQVNAGGTTGTVSFAIKGCGGTDGSSTTNPCEIGNAVARNIIYKINGVVVPALNGRVKSGNTVEVTFTTDANTTKTRFALASYQSPSNGYNEATASQQKLFQSQVVEVTGGTHTLTVKVPDCYFQIDFVRGCVIEQFGPAGSGNFYGDRKIEMAVGGTKSCIECPAITATVVGPDTVCAFQDEPVTYTVTTTGTTDMASYTWTVPGDWEILAGQGTNTIQVQVGSESGQVTVVVTNACGTKATDSQDVFADENCGVLIALPVELTSFTGEATKTGVVLSWITASEKNNEKFEIERSLDGSSYEKVGEVKGNGTTSAKHTYSFRDSKATNGTLYYRLKQVDLDGKSEYSKVIAVNYAMSVAKAGMLVAPNPVTGGAFTISLEGAQGGSLQIVDMNGRVVFKQEVAVGTQQLNLNSQNLNMSRGMYLINIKNNTSNANSKLIVK